MIYPKSSITKTWYQYKSEGGAYVVLEKFSYDPGNTVEPKAVCAGYDMATTIVEEGETVANPNYGKLLQPTNEKLATIFPHLIIRYIVCRVDKTNSTAEETVYQYKNEDGGWVSAKDQANVVEYYMWLDNMVLDGDGCENVSGEKPWEDITFICKSASHPGYNSYKQMFVKKAQADIIDAMMNGTSYDTARNSLPWYTRAEGEHPVVNGEIREIVEVFVCNADDDNGISLTEKLNKDDRMMLEALRDELNERAEECANALNETVVVANELEIDYQFRPSFKLSDEEFDDGETDDTEP